MRSRLISAIRFHANGFASNLYARLSYRLEIHHSLVAFGWRASLMVSPPAAFRRLGPSGNLIACFVVRDANGFPVTANLVYHSACLFFAVILRPATCLSYDAREILHLRALRKSCLMTPRHPRGE